MRSGGGGARVVATMTGRRSVFGSNASGEAALSDHRRNEKEALSERKLTLPANTRIDTKLDSSFGLRHSSKVSP